MAEQDIGSEIIADPPRPGWGTDKPHIFRNQERMEIPRNTTTENNTTYQFWVNNLRGTIGMLNNHSEILANMYGKIEKIENVQSVELKKLQILSHIKSRELDRVEDYETRIIESLKNDQNYKNVNLDSVLKTIDNHMKELKREIKAEEKNLREQTERFGEQEINELEKKLTEQNTQITKYLKDVLDKVNEGNFSEKLLEGEWISIKDFFATIMECAIGGILGDAASSMASRLLKEVKKLPDN